jgi:DNA-binding CsgD family transcriptional regulator
MADAVEETIALRELVDVDRARRIDVLHGALLLARGERGSGPLVDRYTEMVGPDRSSADAMFLAEVVAPVLAFLRRDDDSDALLADLETDLRARGASLAETSGSPELASLAAGVLALSAAVVGDGALCEHAAELLRDVPEPERRAFGPIGLAYLAFNQGRFDEAEAAYRQVNDISPLGRGLLRWEVEWIEALIRVGRRDEAIDVLAELEAAVSPQMMAMTGIGRAKGMLAVDDDIAFAHIQDAVAFGEATQNDFVIGRSEIVWGERLRRSRRRADSRAHLERAVELLRRVGATMFAERATAELRAAGGVIGEDAAPHQLLTPHELQIAKLVVGGASNRDLAAKLFISPRTVEAHLTTIFRKLGVRNRRALAAHALDNPVLQP